MLAQPTVVNVRTDPFDVYIGRPMNGHSDARIRTGSPWRNRFTGPDRELNIRRYVAWLWELYNRRPDQARQMLAPLAGKRLGCWCAPLACHGHEIVRLGQEIGLWGEPAPLDPNPPCPDCGEIATHCDPLGTFRCRNCHIAICRYEAGLDNERNPDPVPHCRDCDDEAELDLHGRCRVCANRRHFTRPVPACV